MTFDITKYAKIVDEKYSKFEQAMNKGFNTLNGTKPLEDMSERVATLHSLILNKQEFDKNFFTEEEYKQEKLITEESTKRLNDLLSGVLKPYIPTEEDLNILVVNIDDVNNCLIDVQEYLEAVKSFNENG